MGDAHVYLNHVDPLKEQLSRQPGDFPTLKITKQTKNIDEILMEDLVIEGYKPQKSIRMKMAV